jgi:hypothetical protein
MLESLWSSFLHQLKLDSIHSKKYIIKKLGIYKVPAVLCCPCERPELVVMRDTNVVGYLK